MNFPIKSDRIAQLISSPTVNVVANMPTILAALEEQTEVTNNVVISVVATIRVECPPFKPIREFGNTAYFTKHYENRADLGNNQPGDGAKYCGRGYVQITGRNNYKHYGDLLGVDLVNNPDLALDPAIAGKVIALYFKTHGCFEAANNQDWKKVRRLVNGGYNGLSVFQAMVDKLLKELTVQSTTP